MPTALDNYNDWAKLAGLVCTCAPGCTGTMWGNGATECSNVCVPCKRMSGKLYTKPPTAGKKK